MLATISSGVLGERGVKFPTFPLTCVFILKTLWHYCASVACEQVHRAFNTLDISHASVNSDLLLVKRMLAEEVNRRKIQRMATNTTL